MKPLRVQQIAGWEFNLSELLRIKSQILAEHDLESAMNCLTEAVAVARAQSAFAWELRSTIALARCTYGSLEIDHLCICPGYLLWTGSRLVIKLTVKFYREILQTLT